jgi:uncharacterized protein (DUF1330 family)
MPAFVVVDGRVTEPEAFKRYQALAEQAVAEAGARFLVRGGLSEVLEGDWDPQRLVVLEFADAETARGWYDSATYQVARVEREGAATLNMVLVEGYAPR